VGADDRAPGAFMAAVDGQKLFGDLDGSGGVVAISHQAFADSASDAKEAGAFVIEPAIEGRIQTIQILQQGALEPGENLDGQPSRLGKGMGIDIECVAAQREVVPVRDEQMAPHRTEGILKFMHALTQRCAGLLIFPPAPEQRRQSCT
jgi:hypothetical protein